MADPRVAKRTLSIPLLTYGIIYIFMIACMMPCIYIEIKNNSAVFMLYFSGISRSQNRR